MTESSDCGRHGDSSEFVTGICEGGCLKLGFTSQNRLRFLILPCLLSCPVDNPPQPSPDFLITPDVRQRTVGCIVG